MASSLIALVPILYGNSQYRRGAVLPITDAAYASELVEAGSAVWRDDDDGSSTTKKRAAKAKSVTAPAGATGSAQPATGAETDLAGKVPSKKARGVVKEPSKRAPKSKA